MGHLLVASEKFGEDVVIISISVQPSYDTVERLQSYREGLGIGWTIARDTDLSISNKYNVSVVPTLVFIDQDGIIRYQHLGLMEEPMLSEKITEIPEFPPPASAVLPITYIYTIIAVVAVAVVAVVAYWYIRK